MKKVIIILIILFIVGGFTAVALGVQTIWETVKEMFIHIFPILSPVFSQASNKACEYNVLEFNIRGCKALYSLLSFVWEI